jgi:hypothetical protein
MQFVEIAMVYVISCRKTSRNQAENQPKNSRNQAKKSKFKRPFKKLGLGMGDGVVRIGRSQSISPHPVKQNMGPSQDSHYDRDLGVILPPAA